MASKIPQIQPNQYAEAIRLYKTGMGTSRIGVKLRVRQHGVQKLINSVGLMRSQDEGRRLDVKARLENKDGTY